MVSAKTRLPVTVPQTVGVKVTCTLQNAPTARGLGVIGQSVAETAKPTPDSESSYDQGAIFAYCGKKNAAFHMLGMAIEHNYCAYTALKTDPLLVKLRETTEFNELLSTAKECQNRILAQQH